MNKADALWCNRGVWDEGRGSDRGQRFEIVTSPRRKKSCFFMPYREGMSLPAAVDLSDREAHAAQAGRSRVPVWISVGIAVIAVVVAYLVAAASQDWWPF